jgi:hypothetical protein
MKNSKLLDPSSYIDNDKISTLADLVEEFTKQDITKFWVDVGNKEVNHSINWKAMVVYDETNNHPITESLAVVNFAKAMRGIRRVTINRLEKYSFMPIHVDTDSLGEYDESGLDNNIIVPIDSNGWSIVDYKVYKNKRSHPVIFEPQIPHGSMNDTSDPRITIYLLVDKRYFNNDNT